MPFSLGPDPAGKDAGDVLAVDGRENSHEALAGSGEAEVISNEDAAGEQGDNRFHIERGACQADLVTPVGRIGGRGLALHQPAVCGETGATDQ